MLPITKKVRQANAIPTPIRERRQRGADMETVRSNRR
jgi:hypothetical protein